MRQSNLRIVRTLFVAALLFSVVGARAANWLFRNGKSNYQIVVAADASPSERTAVLELQDYLLQIGGVQLPITSEPDRRRQHIFVGYSPQVAALTGESRPMADDERFTYRSVGRDLLIWGGSQRGTMYGVFTFLERELGVHWLTPDCTVVPQSRQWRLPKLDHSEQPAIGYRYNNYRCTRDQPVWSAHVKENMQGPVTNEYGNQEGYWSCHTMGQLVPSREFYTTHPEYFSLRDGKRLSRNEQLYVAPSPLKGRRTSTPL